MKKVELEPKGIIWGPKKQDPGFPWWGWVVIVFIGYALLGGK